MYECHNIVAATLLFLSGNLKGHITDHQVGSHLVQGLISDLVDPQFLLSSEWGKAYSISLVAYREPKDVE